MLHFLKIFFLIYLFLERGREGEREGEKHQCVVVFQAPATGDLAHNPGICPDWELNRRPFGSASGAQSTEPHQPGPDVAFLTNWRQDPPPATRLQLTLLWWSGKSLPCLRGMLYTSYNSPLSQKWINAFKSQSRRKKYKNLECSTYCNQWRKSICFKLYQNSD